DGNYKWNWGTGTRLIVNP
uniref:Uncharacterized protein n=1 Tax=Sarcophilus harrisii TaxID=9305 RepID=A0A7N4PKR2_SARHA